LFGDFIAAPDIRFLKRAGYGWRLSTAGRSKGQGGMRWNQGVSWQRIWLAGVAGLPEVSKINGW